MREGEVSEGTSGLEVEPTDFYRNAVLRVWEKKMRKIKQGDRETLTHIKERGAEWAGLAPRRR